VPGGWREDRRIGTNWQQVSERVTASGGLAVLVSDVTTIKETIAALQASEDRFQRMAANIPGYVFQRHVAADGTIRFPYISEGARDFYGCDPDDLMVDPSIIRRAIHPDDFARIDESVRTAITNMTPWQADYRLIARDGSVRWVASQARAVRMGDGSVLWDGVVVDITARKEAEAQLTDAKLRAERATRAKSSFLAAMSHELRTPLNAILGFSELMASTALAPKLAHKAAEYATDIHTAGSHLLQLINDLLDLSKAEAGKMELAESEVEIGGIVERVLRLVEGHARDGGVMIATAVPATLPRLRADDRKILQMVLNLVANAVKFTPSGGKVTIAATISSDGDLRLTVADTGVGIAAKNLPRVLVPFAQVDNDITRRTNGTGLGLPIAKQFADLHGGSLSIESVEGQGTTVTVRLPGERLIDLEPEELRRVG
jgi:PAS domain S-box-containing protein